MGLLEAGEEINTEANASALFFAIVHSFLIQGISKLFSFLIPDSIVEVPLSLMGMSSSVIHFLQSTPGDHMVPDTADWRRKSRDC